MLNRKYTLRNCYIMSSFLLNAVTFAINKLYSHGVKLKDEQFRAVESVLCGKDVLAVLPTRFGKLLMYQILPDVFDYMSTNSHLSKGKKGCVGSLILVVSPLNALMCHQITKLNKRGIQSFMVTKVVSDNEQVQYNISVDSLKDLSCTCKIIYFHAELCIKNKSFFNALKSTGFQKRVKCVVVDEAHLIKEWYECLINLHECPFYSTYVLSPNGSFTVLHIYCTAHRILQHGHPPLLYSPCLCK